MQNKILLHSCCAICSAYPITLLKEMGYEVISFFYNPNIYPETEYYKRLEAHRILCDNLNITLIEGHYTPENFYSRVKGLENEPEKGKRCDKCFQLRLKETANLAKKLGIKEFTTSIVISPHKNFKKLSEIGELVAKDFDLEYKAIDFKKQDGFLKTNQLSKKMELYRQNYCGCEYSITKK